MIRQRLFYGTVISLFVLSCNSPAPNDPAPVTAGSTDTTQTKATISYAHGFTIDYHDGFKVVRILDHSNNKFDTLEYLLVQKGHPTPTGYPGARIISIPIQSMAVLSSMHVGIADFVGVSDRITGLGSLQYVNSGIVRDRIKAGKIAEVGLDGNLNNELLISMHPGLLMTSSNPEAGAGKYKVLTDAGIPVVVNAEWLETTPLGRAEWVKLLAALTNREAVVNKKFDSMVRSYDSLVQLAHQAKTHPHVIIGMPYKGAWFLPAGDSYMAHFIEDAGGGYYWSGSKGIGSLPLNFESVAPEALKAEYWMNIGFIDTKQEIVSKDPRYASFLSFRNGNLYNNNKQTNDLGSNDYWESGAVNPHIVLADMISILHPELLPGHTLVYYKQLQ